MTLATHAIVGGAVSSLFPSHPVIAFFAGFFSHFILDAMPHWDYKIMSAYANPSIAMSVNTVKPGASGKFKADRNFAVDLSHISADLVLGILMVLFVLHPAVVAEWKILALGVIGGILPDFLQFVYMRFPHQPMILIQKFHSFMDTRHKLNDKPFIGIVSQGAVIVSVIILVKYLVQL